MPWWDDDQDFAKSDWALNSIHWKEWPGLLFAAIEPADTLEAQLGVLTSEIADEPNETFKCVHEERLVFDANCKVYTDDFVEGYHIRGVHPAFHQAIDLEAFETVTMTA